MITLIVVVLAVIAVIFFINSYQNKYQSFQGVVFNGIVVFLLLFFLISVSYVYRVADKDLSNFRGVVDFSKLYFNWVFTFFRTVGGITGNVVKQDWSFSSNFSK